MSTFLTIEKILSFSPLARGSTDKQQLYFLFQSTSQEIKNAVGNCSYPIFSVSSDGTETLQAQLFCYKLESEYEKSSTNVQEKIVNVPVKV